MALYIDGFEQYTQAGNVGSAGLLRMSGYEVSGSGLSLSAGKPVFVDRVSIPGRSAISLSGNVALLRPVQWSTDIMSVGTAFRFTERGGMFRLATDAGDITLWSNRDTGELNMLGHTGYVTPVISRFYYVEIEINRILNTAKVWVNSKLDLEVILPFSLAGVDLVTLDFFPNDINASNGELLPSRSAPGTNTYDDFYVKDGGKLGPIAVFTRFPGESLQNDFKNSTAFPGGANLSNPALLSGSLQLLNYYLYADAPGAAERYTSPALVSARDPRVIAMGVLARRSVPENRGLRLRTDNLSADISPLDNGFSFEQRILSTGGGYTKSSIESSVLGVEVI